MPMHALDGSDAHEARQGHAAALSCLRAHTVFSADLHETRSVTAERVRHAPACTKDACPLCGWYVCDWYCTVNHVDLPRRPCASGRTVISRRAAGSRPRTANTVSRGLPARARI